MPRLLKTKFLLFLLCMGLASSGMGQSWKPSMKGINLKHGGDLGVDFHLDFKTDGPMNKDWVYGGYFDEDSLRRCVAYREGGRWVPLPFHGYKSNKAMDIGMFGDTLYIIGSFGNLVLDKDTSVHLPNTGLLKWYNDSLWAAPTQRINGPSKMSAKGDSLLIWGASYFNPPAIVYFQFMTPDGGATWQYPYSIIHPTESTANFGARSGLRILDNGDILTINNGSLGSSGYRGLNRWDGQQWHTYGSPIFSPNTWVNDFEFYNGELYMGGTFSSLDFPAGPTDFVGHWDGTKWEDLATGITAPVVDLFVHDSTLYCQVDRTLNPHYFGDVEIPYLAGWDGNQWCGTAANFEVAPISMGVINDTLYATFYIPNTINGDPVSYMNYYDGDYLHGPGSICSTLGISKAEEVISEPVFKIYPNPVENKFRVSVTRGELKDLKIYDVSGNLLMEIKPDLVLKDLELDLSGFISGMYHLQINDEHHIKLIKKY